MTKLLPNNARILSGEVWLDQEELLGRADEDMQQVRGSRISMMFQDPMTSLDPAFTVGDQVVETLREHTDLGRAEAAGRASELFHQVGIPAPQQRLGAYPHQMSGGMRQRVALAIAICCHPRVFIADEPTTAVDVTIQAQILRLIKDLVEHERGMGVLLITHDLGIVAQTCDRIAVMYAGQIVELADTFSLFGEPRHPYTQALLESAVGRGAGRGKLPTIEGAVPDLRNLPTGCHFHPRCERATAVCSKESPPRVSLPDGGEVACVLYRD
jgi:oligopeptide/dipeptide ABC transporter ATP-binding protein